MPRFKKIHANPDGWSEWEQPVRKGYRMACCDCGLVHTMDFRIRNGRIQFRARRNNRSTAQIRRYMKTGGKLITCRQQYSHH